MSKVTFIAPVGGMHGKIHHKSDMWIMERNGTFCTGKSCHPRDYKKKPHSEAEKAGTLRLAAASKAYNQLVKGSPEWQALQDKWLEQKDLPNGKRFFRGYCISQYMQQAAKKNS